MTPDGEPVALGGHRQRMVLSLLMLHVGEAVSIDRLIDRVWGAHPPPTARKTLQVYVSRLRRAMGNGDIAAVRGGYRLAVEPEQVDAVVFEQLAAEGSRLLGSDPAAAATTLRSALALWRGAPWGELAAEPALSVDAERLRELRLAVLEDRIAADLALGPGDEQVGELRALLAEHPLRERLRGLLMVALYRQGRTAAALRLYEDGRRLLADELGADPGPELRGVHAAILRQDRDLLLTPGDTPPLHPRDLPNPYKGLRAFDEDDAADYFGRGELVDTLAAQVNDGPLLVLVGPSGSGKSSAVRAGLLPALRAGGPPEGPSWSIATMVPGARPFEELGGALARAGVAGRADSASWPTHGDDLDLLRMAQHAVPDDTGRLLLVIDQFEELFLQVADEAERERFLRNIAEAVEDPCSRLTIVAVLRADLLDHPMSHPRLGRSIVENLIHVVPLQPAELETACVMPAARSGVTVEAELAAELVAEVADRPGALPLFQYTLTDLFERRDGEVMTLHSYRETGGIRGVVARRADETYRGLAPAAQRVCRAVFLRLVAVGDEGELGRRRVTREELDDLTVEPDPVTEVIDRFGAARLLAFDRGTATGRATVEVAHEALLWAWPRLRGWVEEGRGDLRVQRSVSAATAEWEASGRQEAYLLSGARLDTASDWRSRSPQAATATEIAYIEAGLARQQRQRDAEEARRRRELQLERRASRRLRQLVAVLAVAAVVAGGLGTVAMVQRTRARGQTAVAQAAERLARAQTLANAAVANRTLDPQRSLLLALHAVTIAAQSGDPVPRSFVEALHWALQADQSAYPGRPDVVVATGPQGRRGFFAVPLDELYTLARARASRELAGTECRTYFGLPTCPDLPAAMPGLVAASPAADAVGPDALEGTRVTVAAGVYGEQQALRAEFAGFTRRTGIDVVLELPSDLIPWAERRIDEHDPPDIVVWAQPSNLLSTAARGRVMDLSAHLDADALRSNFSSHLMSLVSDDDAVYGFPLRITHKSILWYAPSVFADQGYALPSTYDELLALTRQMAADGITPWCHGEAIGPSGWPGTDVIENLLLHASIEDYDDWLAHTIGFDDPPLRRAFERMRQLLLEPGHVVGGPAAAATRQLGYASDPLFTEPPGCALYPMASFATEDFPAGVEVGRDVGALPFPPVDPGQGPVVLGAGDWAAALVDRPEVREVMRFLSSDEFGRQWAVRSTSFISPHAAFPVEAYACDGAGASSVACVTDATGTTVAASLADAIAADRFRFDGSDLLPYGVGQGPMWDAMVAFVAAGGENLDDVLTDLEATWVEREQAAASEAG